MSVSSFSQDYGSICFAILFADSEIFVVGGNGTCSMFGVSCKHPEPWSECQSIPSALHNVPCRHRGCLAVWASSLSRSYIWRVPVVTDWRYVNSLFLDLLRSTHLSVNGSQTLIGSHCSIKASVRLKWHFFFARLASGLQDLSY